MGAATIQSLASAKAAELQPHHYKAGDSVISKRTASVAQPNDAGVNRAFKSRVRQSFQTWFAMETARLGVGRAKDVDTRMSVIKNLHLGWVRLGIEHLLSKPEIVRSSWRSVGLLMDSHAPAAPPAAAHVLAAGNVSGDAEQELEK